MRDLKALMKVQESRDMMKKKKMMIDAKGSEFDSRRSIIRGCMCYARSSSGSALK